MFKKYKNVLFLILFILICNTFIITTYADDINSNKETNTELSANDDSKLDISTVTDNIISVIEMDQRNVFNLPEKYYKSLTDEEKDILEDTYNELYNNNFDENHFRYKAIRAGLSMLHWGYSRDTRWKYVEDKDWGQRDCSSFTYTCYGPYTTFFGNIKLNNTSTTSILYTIRDKKLQVLYEDIVKRLQQEYEKNWLYNLDDYLLPGDIILCTGNKSREENIGHVAIYLCKGYVLHANGGDNGGLDGIHIEKWKKFAIYGDRINEIQGPKYIISIPNEYNRNIAFDLKYRNFKNYYQYLNNY